MNRFSTHLTCATALALATSPALAVNKSDTLFLSQLHEKIVVARAEPGMAQNGQADLDRAEAVLTPLYKGFDGKDRKAATNITGQVDALIETARTHTRIAALKTEIVQLQARGDSRLAAAENDAAAAQLAASQASSSATAARADAAASRVEADALRNQLRDSQMKQTQLGATLVLSDVSFTTGSSILQAGAVERLRPMASYLRGNPGVRVQIDGHTDSQGTAGVNQTLSDDRAEAVRRSLSSMGIDWGRIDAIGHGEDMPVADNAMVEGRQQNRRVEITLVGQNATDFAEH
jgi:outer membrane protein OmpA-like peptidoglycan-associated protein